MSRAATLTSTARADLFHITAWLTRDDLSAAVAFRAAVDQALVLIGEQPRIGRTRSEFVPSRYRFWSLTRFPYVMVYYAATVRVRVVRVLHTARDFPRVLRHLDS